MPTASTIPLILLLFFLWKRTNGEILSAVLFTSVFTAASPLNIGLVGVPCWLLSLVILSVVKVVVGHRPYHFTSGISRPAVNCVLAFVSYALFSAFVYPLLFAGTVIYRRSGMQPLSWDISNFAQCGYLVAVVVVYFIALSSSRERLLSAFDWYIRGCVTSAIIAIYQLVSATTHIPYPDAVLYSNKVHVIYRAYKIGGMWRLNGTFNEASEMSTFMLAAMALLGWKILTQPLRLRDVASFGLLLACLIMTQSSTGYITLAVMLVAGGWICARYLFRGGTISRDYVVLGIVAMVVLAGVLTFTGDAVGVIQSVVRSTIIEKANSQSYQQRVGSDVAALETLSKTYFVGAGWGSIRASGLIYNLLGNIGIPGLILFIILIGALFQPLFRHSRIDVEKDVGDPYVRSLFAMTLYLIAMVVSGSEIGDPLLWILFGSATIGPLPPRAAITRNAEIPSRSWEKTSLSRLADWNWARKRERRAWNINGSIERIFR